MILAKINCFLGIHEWRPNNFVNLRKSTQELYCEFCDKRITFPVAIKRPMFIDGKCHHANIITNDRVDITETPMGKHYKRTYMECYDCGQAFDLAPDIET